MLMFGICDIVVVMGTSEGSRSIGVLAGNGWREGLMVWSGDSSPV